MKGGPETTSAKIGFATAVVGLVTALVTVAATLVSRGDSPAASTSARGAATAQVELRPLSPSAAPSVSASTLASASPSPAPTSVATKPVQNAVAGRVLLEDDFAKPDIGWRPYSGEFGVVDTSASRLRVLAAAPPAGQHTTLWAVNRTISAKDLIVEVDAVHQQGDDASYGLICRFTDRNNFYEFDVSSSGTYGIGATIAGKPRWLGESDAEPSSAVLLGKAINRIRAECIGDQLSLYVNDKRLLTVTDASVESGRAGVIVNNNDPKAPAEILFDNYVVRAAPTR